MPALRSVLDPYYLPLHAVVLSVFAYAGYQLYRTGTRSIDVSFDRTHNPHPWQKVDPNATPERMFNNPPPTGVVDAFAQYRKPQGPNTAGTATDPTPGQAGQATSPEQLDPRVRPRS